MIYSTCVHHGRPLMSCALYIIACLPPMIIWMAHYLIYLPSCIGAYIRAWSTYTLHATRTNTWLPIEACKILCAVLGHLVHANYVLTFPWGKLRDLLFICDYMMLIVPSCMRYLHYYDRVCWFRYIDPTWRCMPRTMILVVAPVMLYIYPYLHTCCRPTMLVVMLFH